MKIRQGFVSNSSTSSFTCSACNCIEAGREVGLEDLDMFHCENGHYIHKECAGWPCLDPPEGYIKAYVEKYSNEDNSEDRLEDLKEDAEYEYLDNIPYKYCPVCCFSKLSNKDELAYYRHKLNTTKEKTREEIIKEFTHYKDLCSKIY